jgi:hypothetical protein
MQVCKMQLSVAAGSGAIQVGVVILLLAAHHVRQVVFTHRLGQRQASVLAAARVVEIRLVNVAIQGIAGNTNGGFEGRG